MKSDGDKAPSGFLYPSFGTPPEKEEEEDWDEVQQWVDRILDPSKPYESWNSQPEKPLQTVLAEREAAMKSEREAELLHIRKLREGRDSLLRQLAMATDAQQLGWVTTRFHTLVSKAEELRDRMVHLKSGIHDELSVAQEMFHNALGVARDRVSSQAAAAKSLAEHEANIRKIRQDAVDYSRKLWEETQRKARESNDRNFRKYHMHYCECGNSKPTGHLFCLECHANYGRTRWR